MMTQTKIVPPHPARTVEELRAVVDWGEALCDRLGKELMQVGVPFKDADFICRYHRKYHCTQEDLCGWIFWCFMRMPTKPWDESEDTEGLAMLHHSEDLLGRVAQGPSA